MKDSAGRKACSNPCRRNEGAEDQFPVARLTTIVTAHAEVGGGTVAKGQGDCSKRMPLVRNELTVSETFKFPVAGIHVVAQLVGPAVIRNHSENVVIGVIPAIYNFPDSE